MLPVSQKLRSRWQLSPFKRPLLPKIFAIVLAFCFGLGIALALFKASTVEIPIFGFHDVIDFNNPAELPPQRPPQKGDYSKQKLATFIEYLVRNNYWFLSTDELYDYFLSENKREIPPERKQQTPIILSFDDGYKSAHRNLFAIAEDIEQRYGQKIKLVWFINPAFLGIRGTQLERISCDDLRLGIERGYYDVQSHGLNHLDLTKIDAKKRDRELKVAREELQNCTRGLDSTLQIASQISYPFGAVNSTIEKDIARYYRAGYLYNSRILRPAYLKNHYQIPRLTVDDKMSIVRLKLFAARLWL